MAIAWAVVPAVAEADENLGTAGSLTYIRDSTSNVSPGDTAVTHADCPTGLRLTGGAADAVRGNNEGLLSTTNPLSGGKLSWQTYTQNTDTASRTADSYAICRAGRPAVPEASARMPPTEARTKKVACPAGTRVTGGGVYESGPVNAMWVNATRPFDGSDADARPDDGWRGKAYNATAIQQTLTVYAVCRDVPVTYRSGIGGVGNGYSAGIGTPSCPNDRHLSGVGGVIGGSAALNRLSGLIPSDNSIEPDADPDDNAVVEGVNGTSPPGNAALGGDSLCVP